MKHKHYDMIVASAADTSRIVECRDPGEECAPWFMKNHSNWFTELEYRFKPEPKPDVVRYACLERHDWTETPYSNSNARITFDGETGAPKSMEILK